MEKKDEQPAAVAAPREFTEAEREAHQLIEWGEKLPDAPNKCNLRHFRRATNGIIPGSGIVTLDVQAQFMDGSVRPVARATFEFDGPMFLQGLLGATATEVPPLIKDFAAAAIEFGKQMQAEAEANKGRIVTADAEQLARLKKAGGLH